MLLERVGLERPQARDANASRPRPAAPARRSTRPPPRARSSARGARTPACAASTFAASPTHACSADCCSARPYEKDSGHGPPTWLIAFRFSVASTSDWPPERKTIPGTAAGTCAQEALHRQLGDPRRRRLLRAALPGDDHVRLQQRRRGGRPAGRRARRNVHFSVRDVTSKQRSIVLSASMSTSGSTIGTMPGLLAERRVARERVRVRADARDRRDAVADRDHGAPLGEARAEPAVLLEPRAQAVEPLRDLLAREAGEVAARPCRP